MRYLVTAVIAIVYFSVSGLAMASGIQHVKKSGAYSGNIVSVSYCKAAAGDRRYCNDLDLKLGTGKVVRAKFYMNVTIAKKNHLIYNGPNYNTPQVDQVNTIDKIVKNNLHRGVAVESVVSCGKDSGCSISAITIK